MHILSNLTLLQQILLTFGLLVILVFLIQLNLRQERKNDELEDEDGWGDQ